MELRARGWSIAGAAREVGVWRTPGNNWAHGYKTYRNGVVVDVVPALERLAVRKISERFLSQDERIEIADLRHAGLSIGKDRATLGTRAVDDLARAASQRRRSWCVPAVDAHRQATARRARDRKRRIDTNTQLRELVAKLLAQ